MDNLSLIELGNIVRYIIILATSIICSAYIYIKSSKIKLTVLKQTLLLLLILFISFLCSYLRIIGFPYYVIISIVLTLLSFMMFSKNSFYTTIPTIIISIGIAYCIEVISISIMVTICSLIHYYNVNVFTELLTSICQIIITYFFMKIRRLQNGFSFFENKKYFGIGIIICGPIITLVSILKDYMDVTVKTIIGIGTIISAIGIFIWINYAFKRYYRKRLKLRAEEYSKLELAEKSREIEKLSGENTTLSSIIHLDNQIIQTIETELNKLNNTKPANKLLISINQRNDYVNSVLIKSKNLASTGNAGVDAVLLDLYIKAASRGIDFNLNTDCDINYLINNIITNNDFEALLRELIANSIIAVENNPKITGRISINISQPNDIYELTVMDNGSFIDNNSIYDIIEKSKASITTNHFENNDSFTKSVTIRFDGLNMSERIFSKQRHMI